MASRASALFRAMPVKRPAANGKMFASL